MTTSAQKSAASRLPMVASFFQIICSGLAAGPHDASMTSLERMASFFQSRPTKSLVDIISVMRPSWMLLAVCLVGCSSSSSDDKQNKKTFAPPPMHFTATNTSNPVAKYLELVGFRINETKPGHLQIQFGVANHSEADIGDVKMTINLGTTAAKPGDPPLITFPASVSKLGPSDLKDVTVDVPTKMRVYELPDWQFLKADFQITEPR
jgi:hypothetical protein